MKNDDISGLLSVVRGIVKDRAMDDALRRAEAAQRTYLMEKARADRERSRAVIRSIADLDCAVMRVKHEYSRLEPSLSEGEKQAFIQLFSGFEEERENLRNEKRGISGIRKVL